MTTAPKHKAVSLRERKILSGGMIGKVALAIEMGADAVDIGKTIQPPTLRERMGMRLRGSNFNMKMVSTAYIYCVCSY